MSNGARQRWGLQLMTETANAFRLRDGTFTQIDPDGLRFVGTILAWMHWAFGVHVLVQMLYRPLYGYWTPQFVAYLLILVLLMAFNGYFHYRVLSNRAITWRWVLAFCAMDVTVLSVAIAISDGFSNYFFHLFYYPPLAFLAVVLTSFRINMALVTVVAIIYLALSLTAGDGLDFEAKDEKALLARIFVMYLVVVLVNLISGFERARWRQAVEREQTLLRERTELSQAIHDTAAQTAYMIGLGIHRARMLADESNGELLAALDATSALSKSAAWELRRPIDAGLIFEGRELGRVLWSHCATFEKITGVPARMSQSGTEPRLATGTRTHLFSIAHNALANAFLHARPGRVEVGLDFEAGQIRLSVSDDGVGLPEGYAKRGRGFDGMRADAERMGGRLIVESGGEQGGTTITCVVPYEAGEGD